MMAVREKESERTMDNPSGRETITLPSALRPARVSIVSNGGSNSHQSREDNGNGINSNVDLFTSAQAFDTVLPNGAINDLASSPLSATKRLYSNSSSSAARASTNAGNRASIGAGVHPKDDHNTSPSRRTTGLPSILPNSAFLTPRKPSHSPRYSQPNSATLRTPISAGTSAGISPSNSFTGEDNSTSRGHGSSFAKQQLQPSLFLADARDATGNQALSPLSTDAPHQSSSLQRNGSSSADGLVTGPYADGSNASTVRSSFNTARARSESQQGTLHSKTSKDPLIAGSVAAGRMSSPGQTRRKTSKTGSITGLLGLRVQSAGPSTSRSREVSASSVSNPVQIVDEGQEKTSGSPGRSQSAGRQDGHLGQRNGSQRIQLRETPHTVVPIVSSKTNKPMRNYQIYRELQQRQHKGGSTSGQNGSSEKTGNPALAYGSTDYGGNNRFLFGGRMVTSGDSPFPFTASFILSLLLPGAFFAFEARWLWDASPSGIGTPGGKALLFLFIYSALIMWTSLLRTAFRDPGIIVKGLDKEPDWESIAVPVGGEDDLTGTGMGQRPKLRHFKVRDEWVSSKWCETCQTYRPPRTSHCRLCDVCTEQTDHHCSFLNNCIGRRNYSSFIAFLISTVVCSAFTLGITAAHLAKSASSDATFWNNWTNIGSIALLALTTAVALPILGLLGYHCRLIWLSKTTIEILRPRYPSSDGKGKPANPYAYSRRIDNIIYNLCKPMDLYSAIQPRALAEKDARKENPAFT